jgi:hypothetical protein
MPLPPRAAYGDIGNKFLNISFFCIFVFKEQKYFFWMVLKY